VKENLLHIVYKCAIITPVKRSIEFAPHLALLIKGFFFAFFIQGIVQC